MIGPIIKIFGGKKNIYRWVIDNFPAGYENMYYIEPFVGGGSIILNKKPSIKETIIDIDSGLIDLYEKVRSYPWISQKYLEKTPYNETTFNNALLDKYEPWANTYILSRMSRGGMRKTFGKSSRLRGGQDEYKNAWENSIKQIPQISERLSSVNIDCFDAIYSLMSIYNCYPPEEIKNVFVYCDPPYLQSTRIAKSVYENEFTQNQHILLLVTLLRMSELGAKILISGYQSSLYDSFLYRWCKNTKTVKNSSGQGKKKHNRTEVLWKNY